MLEEADSCTIYGLLYEHAGSLACATYRDMPKTGRKEMVRGWRSAAFALLDKLGLLRRSKHTQIPIPFMTGRPKGRAVIEDTHRS